VGTPISSTNKTHRYELTEILLKLAFSNITPSKLYLNIYAYQLSFKGELYTIHPVLSTGTKIWHFQLKKLKRRSRILPLRRHFRSITSIILTSYLAFSTHIRKASRQSISPKHNIFFTTVSLKSALVTNNINERYMIKFVSDLQQVRDFLWVLRFPPPIKLTAAIYLKYC
jgi:hypothetical protein